MYCELEDIEKDFKVPQFNETSAVKGTTIIDWIEQESNNIDARLANKYVVPIDADASPYAYSVLKRICIYLVSDRVRSVLEVRSNVSQIEQAVKIPDTKMRNALKDIDRIMDGTMLLYDAEYSTSGDGVSFGEDDSDPQFTKDGDQW